MALEAGFHAPSTPRTVRLSSTLHAPASVLRQASRTEVYDLRVPQVRGDRAGCRAADSGLLGGRDRRAEVKQRLVLECLRPLVETQGRHP